MRPSLQIEQWTEHYYPTFISVTPASSGPAGQASSGMDESTLDARIRIAKAKKVADVEKDTLRRQRKMDKYRLSKGLPPKKVGEIEASSSMDWLILFGVLLGLLVVMGGMGGLIAWVVIKVSLPLLSTDRLSQSERLTAPLSSLVDGQHLVPQVDSLSVSAACRAVVSLFFSLCISNKRRGAFQTLPS